MTVVWPSAKQRNLRVKPKLSLLGWFWWHLVRKIVQITGVMTNYIGNVGHKETYRPVFPHQQ